MTTKPESVRKAPGTSQASAASHQDGGEGGALTYLCECSDRLTCEPVPSCEDFLQVVRLRGVEHFEDPKTPNKATNQPPMVAKARPDLLAAHLAFAMRPATPKPPLARKSGTKSGTNMAFHIPDPAALLTGALAASKQAVDDAIAMAQAGMRGRTSGLPICQDVELSLVIRYRQCWVPLGYSRGDLLSSISLAPGEELTLEFFTWDRHRIERELNRESSQESSESASVTSRISSEVVSNLQFKIDMGANAKVGGSLSLAEMDLPIDVNGEVGGNFSTEMSASLTTTTANLNEATKQASNVLRNSQKTRILEVSETGSENRSTRRIKNENRCHTINYDYFEILEHYEIRVDVVGVEFVARVPLPDVGAVTAAWLLCHEYPLRRSLLDPLYEAGFDAAKLLRAVEAFRQLATPPPPPPAPATGTGGRNQPDTLGDQLRVLLDAIEQAKQRLAAVKDLSSSEWGALANFFDPGHGAAVRHASKIATRDYITSEMSGIFDRINELASHRDAKGIDLFSYFDIFFSQLNASALMNLVTLSFGGNPQLRLKSFVLFLFPYDDEGLVGAIDTAQKRIEALRPSINAQGAATVALPEPAAAGGTAQPAETVEDKVAREFGLKNIAEAQVELDRLICHLEDHWDHYLTVLYLFEGTAAWRRILDACPQVADLVEPRVIAIQDGYAYFRLKQSEQERRNIAKLADAIDAWRREMAAQEGTKVTLSTKGTTLEARLGACDACEPFIEQHRLHDLALKAEEVKQAVEKTRERKAEADRQAARLTQTPPLLDDPNPEPAPLRVVVEQAPATAPNP